MRIQGEGAREEGGGGRTIVLTAIILAVALFGYIYFFTDLIRNHESSPTKTEAPLRLPLPRKAARLGGISSAAKPLVTATQMAPPASSPAQRGQESVAGKPAGKTPLSAPATTAPAGPSSRNVMKVAPPPSRIAPEPTKTAPPPSPPHDRATKQGAVTYAIQCGPFVTTRELAPARTLLRKAGLSPVVSPGPKQPTSMYRLFVAEYHDAAAAAEERNRLLEVASDAFVLPHGGAYELFAGSYHEKRRAVAIRDRLAERGIRVEFRQVTAPVPTRRLSAGAITSRDAADVLAGRLKEKGIACIVMQPEQ